MKNKLLILLLICFISCKTEPNKINNKKKNVKQVSIDSVFIDEHTGGIIVADTFHLKNNYTLITFPALDKGKKVINFRLIKEKKDNTYLLTNSFESPNIPIYKGNDFKKYFVLHASFGTHNFYFWLYDKETGEEVFTAIGMDFDLKNELILYSDEDDDYKFFIYDVNSKVKTFIDIPYDLMGKHECTSYNDSYKTIYIKRVTDKYYYLGFRDCPSKIEFKVKKAE
ncbi:hypothetical protein [uncultured Flavobacterium sp.]|uniref:hypothetical protein n=1 Tax=uncultured Flavobacterium sp. TaxID=165435 RepID=UPI0030817AAD